MAGVRDARHLAGTSGAHGHAVAAWPASGCRRHPRV